MDAVLVVTLVVMGCALASAIVRQFSQRHRNSVIAFAAIHMEAIKVGYKLENEIALIYGQYARELEFTASHPRFQVSHVELAEQCESEMNAAVSRARSRLLELHERATSIGFLDLLPRLLAEHGTQCPSLRYIVTE